MHVGGVGMSDDIILELKNIKMYFSPHMSLSQAFSSSKKRKQIKAVDDVSLKLFRGEIFGLIGESGSGKTTLGKIVMKLYNQTAGNIIFNGEDITNCDKVRKELYRRQVQMIFQDPADSMNSRLNVGYIIEEPLIIQTRLSISQRREKAMYLLKHVGLPEDAYFRYPHEFSGGQRQRVAIARALALDPEIIVCDEPVSALDVSVQSQVLNLLLDMQEERNLTVLFISHGLNVVRHMSDRVAVMYLGSIVEIADTDELYQNPLHPYTKGLFSAELEPIPRLDRTKKLDTILTDIPSPIDVPTGCPFHTRCTECMEICKTERPELADVGGGHKAACFLVQRS